MYSALLFATIALIEPVQLHPGQTWRVTQTQDELTDQLSVTMQLEDKSAGWAFGFLCTPGSKLGLGVRLDNYPGEREGFHLLPTRIDAGPVRVDKWSVWDKRAALVDRDRVPEYFAGRERLVFRFTKPGGDTFDIVGNLEGSDEVRAKFTQACAEIGAPVSG